MVCAFIFGLIGVLAFAVWCTSVAEAGLGAPVDEVRRVAMKVQSLVYIIFCLVGFALTDLMILWYWISGE
jgi:hypothetical protein